MADSAEGRRFPIKELRRAIVAKAWAVFASVARFYEADIVVHPGQDRVETPVGSNFLN